VNVFAQLRKICVTNQPFIYLFIYFLLEK